MAFLLLSAFAAGALAVVAMEALGLWILILRLNRKVEREELGDKAKAAVAVSSPGDPNPSLYDKQGPIWVLEPDKIPKSGIEDKLPTETRRRKDILEVTPVRKYARIRDCYLVLLDSDCSDVNILLKGCTVVAVSSTRMPSRKWAKRYPIKLENKGAAIYKGHKIIYVYLDTSWEKESWCKALRLASCCDEEKNVWFSKLSKQFRCYLASLNTGYPSFFKPLPGFSLGLTDKSVKLDNSSSKVRQFLKKLTKKSSKGWHDQEERKISGKSRSFQDLILENGSTKMESMRKPICVDDHGVATTMSTTSEPGTKSHLSGISDGDSNHKYCDEGTLFLNVFISRLFFDAKNNVQIRSSLQNRIQRALSNTRIPSYIGEVTCTSVDLGSLPPRILAMRVLPSDMNELCALEIDVEYLGGMLMEVETRLEIQELEFEGEEARLSVNTPGVATPDLLEGFDDLGKQLKLSEETINEIKHKAEGYHDTDESEIPKSSLYSSSQGSRWKSILQSITKQVSQVPLSLKIRVSSLCGTLRLRIKPPPSDQIWIGFTSMPEIQFNLDSFIGDYKITNGHVAVFMISRFKAAIRESLVLPHSESFGIPWMSAEKDDWAPKSVAPFMWCKNNHESSSDTKQEAPCFRHGEETQTVEDNRVNPTTPEVNHENPRHDAGIPQVSYGSFDRVSMDELAVKNSSSQELRAPLLKKDKMQESSPRSAEESPEVLMNSLGLVSVEGQNQNVEDDDSRPRRIGTRERMRGLGKKVGEKLEVKRRHFEEKGRSFVERMRAP
ncbi:uncharacterized protein LOC127246130 [Andrographis paniculata]|uniref:uncharacterized protein LOC127246130 n=1 Tax=Andrographis paniculata TaxID=175694 RepID=UPI0021E6EC70|nr:uncharacterized protein LOC127246130 [Andrographis paniculata]